MQAYRNELGLTQAEFAQLLGMSQSAVSYGERVASENYLLRVALAKIERLVADKSGPVASEVKKIALAALGRDGEE